MSGAYYNEIDPYAAEWLRNLIKAGHIAPGDVDERSIEDVQPSDLRKYTQCHFFAGAGVWSHSLRSAAWSDDRPVWTGSCPCQPFSAAGEGAGFADERHLWPAFHYLIEQCRPAVVFGEQVASKDVDPWIDLVQLDLEAMGYAVGAIAFSSAGVGAPHIRDRCYWVGYSDNAGLEGFGRRHKAASGRLTTVRSTSETGESSRLADTIMQQRQNGGSAIGDEHEAGRWVKGAAAVTGFCSDLRPSETNGFWRDADWLACRDGKWRPVEPSTFPLAHGAASRVGRLRAYGNAINAQAAAAVITSYMEAA